MNKFVIDLKFPINDLDGNPVVDNGSELSGNAVVAAALARTSENTARFMPWAFDLQAGKSLELQKVDVELLSDFIQKKAGFANYIKWPLKKYFDGILKNTKD